MGAWLNHLVAYLYYTWGSVLTNMGVWLNHLVAYLYYIWGLGLTTHGAWLNRLYGRTLSYTIADTRNLL